MSQTGKAQQEFPGDGYCLSGCERTRAGDNWLSTAYVLGGQLEGNRAASYQEVEKW